MIFARLKPALALAVGFSVLLIERIAPYDVRRLSLVAVLLALISIAASPCSAITLGHVDNFNDGTTQGWGVGSPGLFPVNQPDIGQNGAGDHALWMATAGAGGSVPNLLVFNTSTNWTGDWTATGVSRIELDVRDPGSNNFPLAIRLGIVGPDGGPFGGGGGDTYVTQAMPVPSDGQWHRLAFDVSPSSFAAIGGSNINDALASVRHFRILHNPDQSFSGANPGPAGGEFYLDNIQALAAVEPPTTDGDYNENGVVDAADFVVWRDTFGQSVTNQGDDADGNLSGMIDQGDYDFWRERFGNVVAPPGLGAAVPEPASANLVLFFALVYGYYSGRRRGNS